jgi:hypothetical protein
MNGVASDLLALARALRAGHVTPAGASDRLVILAHRVSISAAQAEETSSGWNETLAPPTTDDEGA